MALILDTGPLYAALDRDDADHAACRRLLEDATEPLVVPAPVLVEVEYWTHRRLGTGAWLALLDDIDAGAIGVEDLLAADYRRVRELCDRYADADIGFVDAAVLAVSESDPALCRASAASRRWRCARGRTPDRAGSCGNGLRHGPAAGRHERCVFPRPGHV